MPCGRYLPTFAISDSGRYGKISELTKRTLFTFSPIGTKITKNICFSNHHGKLLYRFPQMRLCSRLSLSLVCLSWEWIPPNPHLPPAAPKNGGFVPGTFFFKPSRQIIVPFPADAPLFAVIFVPCLFVVGMDSPEPPSAACGSEEWRIRARNVLFQTITANYCTVSRRCAFVRGERRKSGPGRGSPGPEQGRNKNV